jgi:hypothetical protein
MIGIMANPSNNNWAAPAAYNRIPGDREPPLLATQNDVESTFAINRQYEPWLASVGINMLRHSDILQTAACVTIICSRPKQRR